MQGLGDDGGDGVDDAFAARGDAGIGATTFHFVDGGIEEALKQAFDAAAGDDVRLGGGVSTIQQYVRAGFVDEMHVVVVPTVLGDGERLFDRTKGNHGLAVVEYVGSPSVAPFRLSRASHSGRA
jgi:dihydrofolate reductase